MQSLRKFAGPATLKVLSIGEQSREFIGTAFAVNDRMVLTCRHVVKDAQAVGHAAVDGCHLGDICGLVWSVHEDLDVALGVAKDPIFDNWLIPSCANIAASATSITCVGYGSEHGGLRQWQDHVAGEDHAYGLVSLQNTLLRGCSGGPALDGERRPVAITVARDRDGAVKYILPVRSFYAWMQESGFRPMKAGSVQPRLWRVPIRPPVLSHEVPAAVVDAFAMTFHSEEPARRHLAATNALVVENNPECLVERQITLQRADQPAFTVPRDFWSFVFSTLGTRSRRSVAALLEADGAPDPRVQDEVAERAFQHFRNRLACPAVDRRE
jgi:hypothetical protein